MNLSFSLLLFLFSAVWVLAAVPQPTARYKLDKNMSGKDSIEPCADGAIEKPLWQDNGSLVFGPGTRVSIGTSSKLSFRNNFTLAARVKLKDDSGYGLIVGAYGSGGLVASTERLKLAIWGKDWIVRRVLPEDVELHIAVTLDKNNHAKMFVNGAEIASKDVRPWPKDPENWTIGCWAEGEQFIGEMADVMIWDKALEPSQIKELADNFGLGGPPVVNDEPAPIDETPESVKAMAEKLKHLAIEPEVLDRYPFHAMLGQERADLALRTLSHKKRAAEEKWLADLIPTFDCPDPIWERCYYYRWFLVRVNYAAKDGTHGFYEGRRGSYGRHITYSSPHIMNEVRWLRDGSYSYGQAEILSRRTKPECGHGRFEQYTHWIQSTIWGTYLVHPDKTRLAKLLPYWKKDIENVFPGGLDVNRPDRDYLLVPTSHYATGMEFQPSWFYFDNYDLKKETPIGRVDYTAYYYANARDMAEILRELGQDNEADKFDRLAERTKRAMENQMWDDESQFFYSVKADTGQKAMVKEVIGIYPFSFVLPDKSKTGAFKTILDTEEFWGPWPVTSCTKKCPMYTPKVKLCNWNGPVWPHAQSLVAYALANAIRVYKAPIVDEAKLYEFLDAYTKIHYEDKGTWKQPNIKEEANVDDGQMYGCPDYFHSTYIDLIITLVAGLVPRNDDTVELYPVVAVPWDHFRLDGVPYRGKILSIVWDERPDGSRYDGVPKGYSLYIDGKLAGTNPKLEHCIFEDVLR